MIQFIVLYGLASVVLVALGFWLIRLVMLDGLGCNATPRSHAAELGTWTDRQLQR